MEKQSASNRKISRTILCMIFSILFIFTAFPTTTQARPADFDGTAESCMKWDSTRHMWIYDAPMGESGLDGINIPDTSINGADTVGSLAPTYTYWAGDSNRCGVICYVIDLTTNKMDRTYTPFIMIKNDKDSNNDSWQGMVNTARFPLRTGDIVTYSGVSVNFVESIAPVFWSGDSWSSNESAVEADLLSEDPDYQYKMLYYWKIYSPLSMTQLQELAKKVSDQKATLAFETVSAQSFFSSTDPDSREQIQGSNSQQGGFSITTSVAHHGEVMRCFTTEYGFAQHYKSKGITGLEGSTLNWKWFQATAGSMILQESAAGINVPDGNVSIGSISSSEASIQNNGYAIIMLKVSLPPLHTYYEPNGTPGNTEPPSPDNGTDGDCTIKKLYYTQELASDGTIITEAKDYHPYTQTSTTAYISIDTESGYEIEGWKTSTTNTTLNTKEQFNSITPTHTGTSSQEILLDQDTGEKYLYILYKKTEVNPNPPQPYDFQLQQSQITKRVTFLTSSGPANTSSLITHNFTWTASAPTQTSCTSHGGNGHHLNCSKEWDTEPEDGVAHTHSPSCPADCNEEWDTEPVAGVEHSHSNSCYDTPCTSWQWTDNTTSLGITIDTSSLNKAVVSKNDSITYNQPAVNTITTSNKYYKDNTSTRSGTSQNTQSISNFNYITVLFRGQDHLTLADWKNGGAISYLTNLAYDSAYNFKSANTPQGTRKSGTEYNETFATRFINRSPDMSTTYKATIGSAGICSTTASSYRFDTDFTLNDIVVNDPVGFIFLHIFRTTDTYKIQS